MNTWRSLIMGLGIIALAAFLILCAIGLYGLWQSAYIFIFRQMP